MNDEVKELCRHYRNEFVRDGKIGALGYGLGDVLGHPWGRPFSPPAGVLRAPDIDDNGKIVGFGDVGLWPPKPQDDFWKEQSRKMMNLAKAAIDDLAKALAANGNEYRRGYRTASGKPWPPKSGPKGGRPRKAKTMH